MAKYGKGYTLIEVVIVLIILGVLVVLATPTFEKMLEKSKEVEARNILGVIKRHQTVVETETGAYAGSLGGLNVDISPSPYWDFSVTNAYGRLSGNPGFTAAAWRKGKDIQFHMHEEGDIRRTLQPTESHGHNDGNPNHSHSLPPP